MSAVNDLQHRPVSRVVNKAQAAEFFGVSVPTVDAWLRRDCPYVQRGGKGKQWQLDLLDVAQWRFGAMDEHTEDPEKMDPKARLDWYKGSRERDNHAKERGLLIPFDLEEQLIGAAFASVKAGLLGQHNTIASQYPEIPKDAIRGLLSANRDLLKRLSETRLPDSIAGALDELLGEPGAAA